MINGIKFERKELVEFVQDNSKVIKQIVSSYSNAIDAKKFSDIYYDLSISSPRAPRSLLTAILLLSDINPLEYLDEVIPDMFTGLPIETVTVPSNIKTLNIASFYDCPIHQLVLPTSIKQIDTRAIAFCPDLHEIEYQGKMSEFKEIKFGDDWCLISAIKKAVCIDGDVKIDRL